MSNPKLKTYVLVTLALAAVGGVILAGCSREDVVAPMNTLSMVAVGSVNGVPGEYCTTLFAGQTIEAGTVCAEIIDNGDTEELCLTYTTTDGWELIEAHTWVGEDLADMPQTRKGNPVVGNFPYPSGDITGQTTYTVCIDLNQFGNEGGAVDLCGMMLYAAAHAALGKDTDGDGVYDQTETGWGDGDRMVDRGNWATYFTVELACDYGNSGGEETGETAFAFGCDDATCFLDFTDEDGTGFNRWGWFNGPLAAGTYYMDIYAGAGQCDLTKGTLVGLLTVVYDGAIAVVTYETCGSYYMDEVHLYVGNEPLARDVNGDYTVAPGQYPYIDDDIATNSYTFTVGGLSGDIYVVAHAVVVGDYSQGGCGTPGCVPPSPSCTATAMYGTSLDLGGDIYSIDPVTGTSMRWLDISTKTVSPAISPINSSSPNGNAIDGATSRFYFTSFRDPGSPPSVTVPPSELYFVDLDDATQTIHHAGTLAGHASDGTFYDGSFWYIGHGTNVLKEVALNADGTMAGEIDHGAISDAYPYLGFGDIAFNCAGVLYIGATVRAAGNGIVGFLNATYDLGTGVFSGTDVDAASFWGQLAFGTDGTTLYGHAAGTGAFYTINDDGTMSLSFNDGKFTDLASGLIQGP